MHKGIVPRGRLGMNFAIIDPPPDLSDGPIALLRSVIGIMLRYKLKLTLWVGACVLLAALYALTASPTYIATATILLEPRRPVVASAREAAAMPTLDLNRADSELQVIRSERLLTQVFDGLDLANSNEFGPRESAVTSWISGVSRLVGWSAPNSSAPAAPALSDTARQSAFAGFSQRLAARRVGQSYVVEISFSSSNPAFAARVANAAASAYLLQSIAFKADAARSGAEFLQGRVDNLDAQVKAAAAGVVAGALPTSPTPDADARVIGAARRPLSPSAPRFGLIVALGGVFGLLSGLFAAALASVLDKRVLSAERLIRASGVACIAAVPEASDWNGLSRRSAAEMDSFVAFHPESAFASGIRDLRTSIKLACAAVQGKEYHIIALISREPHSGCTFLCMNLARLIQKSGKGVTVIDADMHGTERTLIGKPHHAVSTLADLLTGSAEQQIVFLDLDGVAVLPSGSPDPKQNNLIDFQDPKFVRILEIARSRGDVLLDLPPLSESADARAAAIYADAVVIVTTAGQTSDKLRDMIQLLKNDGANVIGAVLNRAKTRF